jgi:hypothetical protein
MRFVSILLLAALAACSSNSSQKDTSPSFSGKTYDQLVAEFGSPEKMYDLVSGAQLVQYSARDTMNSSGGKVQERSCVARFWLYDKVVKTSTFDGDDDVCMKLQRGGRNVTGRQPVSTSGPGNILQPANRGSSYNQPTDAGMDPPIDQPSKQPWGDVPKY